MCRRLTEGIDLSAALSLGFPGCRIDVQSNSASLEAELRLRFVDFLASDPGEPDMRIHAVNTPPPDLGLNFMVARQVKGGSPTREEFVSLRDGRIVRGRLSRMQFLFGGPHHLAIGPCLASDDQVVDFVTSRRVQHALVRGYLLGRAAAVVSGDRGLAIADVSGQRGSDLAWRLMEGGASLVSGSRLLIRRRQGLEMLGLPGVPRSDTLWDPERDVDTRLLRGSGPGRVQLSAPLSGLVLLHARDEGAANRIARVDHGRDHDLLRAFRRPAGLFYLAPSGGGPDLGPRAYLDTLAGCPVFEVEGGVDSERALEACASFLQGGEMAS